MESKLSNNAILKGYLDAYCLVCESYFKCASILDGHILNLEHMKKLNDVGYMEKYKDDRIRKVKNGYFCEFCNLLLNTAAIVKVHVDDPQHVYKKGSTLLKRVGNKVMAFETIAIKDKAWNGIIDETCLVCNIEFENADIHKNEAPHKLNLVQCKTEFGNFGIIYRKVEDNSFHCLICNIVFAMTDFVTHFETQEHKQLCLPPSPPIISVPDSETTPKDMAGDEKEHEKAKAKLIDALNKKPLQPETPCVDIQKPLLRRVVSEEYEYLICHFVKATSFMVRIDLSNMRCILCEQTIKVACTESHLKDPHHHNLLKLHKKRLQLCDQIEQQEAETEILDSLTRFEKNNIDVDLIKGTAVCNVCFKRIDFLSSTIDAHIEEHNMSSIAEEIAAQKVREADETAAKISAEVASEKAAAELASAHTAHQTVATRSKPKRNRSRSSSTMSAEEMKEWAIKHNIIFNSFQNTATCNICHSLVPTDVKNLKEHVAGNVHRKLLEKNLTGETSSKSKLNKITKLRFESAFISLELVEYMFSRYFIIDNKLFISHKSMFLLKKCDEGYLKCFLCGVVVNDSFDGIESHSVVPTHSLSMRNAYVITSLDTDFVRQMPSGQYHCGFCNHIEENWDALHKHLNTVDHKENKICAQWLLFEFNFLRKLGLNN